MNTVAKFEKVGYSQFKKDWLDCCLKQNISTTDENTIKRIYENIKLPERATTGSAGYDFYAPCSIKLNRNEAIMIPTGIRCRIRPDWFLAIYPRSGQGFKYGIHLSNTCGIVDEDYYAAKNEGHIFVKLVNDSIIAQDLYIEGGQAFCQGVFQTYGVTVDDKSNGVRTGGLGSTDKI